jgi:hypothetical protein
MDFEQILNQLKKKPLSGREIMEALNNETKIIKYSDMWKYDNINEVLHPFNNAVILYQVRPDFGHWVCIIKHKNNTLEYFDPYGFSIDHPIKYIKQPFRKQSRQDFPQLIRLFLNSPYNIQINHKKIQTFDKKTSTCGRHIIMRLTLKHVPLKEYQKIFKNENGMNGDEKITALTAFI